MAHSWVVWELLTASASLHLVKDKEKNAAVPLSSNIASTPLNDFPLGAEDALSHLTGNKRNQFEKAAILKNLKMAN